ncbi:MAG TPA: DUF393 domain-containing protein [Pirellulales bacterium]|jgi:predicted DCC family thiol-disulfide oxidoreductase YuxK|nr:DUF393 domain-containing protein [Pirellulales bacterium]
MAEALANTVAANPLPTPAERPDAAIVIYDGHCRFCTGAVKKLAKWDLRGRLAYLSLHDPEVGRRWPDVSHDDLMKEMLIVDREGKRYWGAAAFRWCTLRLPLLWPLAPLMYIPGSLPLWKFLYRNFAKRRYLFGRVQTCENDVCHIGK